MSVLNVGTRGFVTAVNHLLKSAPWARERLAPHAERCVRLLAEPVDLLFTIDIHGYLVEAAADCEPAVTLSLPLSAVPGLLAGDANKAMNAVRIEGNADLADALGFVFRNLRWDVEEDLSRVFGDIVAHRLVLGAQGLRQFHERAWAGLTGNVAEYLAEEQQALVNRLAVGGFSDDLRALRDDLARLEKRLDRLAAAAR